MHAITTFTEKIGILLNINFILPDQITAIFHREVVNLNARRLSSYKYKQNNQEQSPEVLYKKMVLKSSQYSQENICVGASP